MNTKANDPSPVEAVTDAVRAQESANRATQAAHAAIDNNANTTANAGPSPANADYNVNAPIAPARQQGFFRRNRKYFIGGAVTGAILAGGYYAVVHLTDWLD